MSIFLIKPNINNILNNNPQLRSKRELIEKFINENLANIKNTDDINQEFDKFWNLGAKGKNGCLKT